MPVKKNLDLGRPLEFGDIEHAFVFPIQKENNGRVFCFCCQDDGRDTDNLVPLRLSTGVFTTLIRSQNGEPVFLCLEHIPYGDGSVEIFTPEVTELLRQKRNKQNTVTSTPRM
ncbi:hypothetical protein [Thalassospira xiamenensis]|uniref:Uncharacterized protein n=1 Tax=Thalassospira xiamenensis TaxID=220697 RepID=A0A285TY03_9PROT|nr:hypothetical protein [Thalassospira xiamenensis]SOC30945.1 hypothetical protein SAMN05428964_11126 [Thalassospira xiamenensis]